MVASDVDELARIGAALVRDEAQRSMEARGQFRLVLSGGETPRALYARLAEDEAYRDFPWPFTQVFWGDDRHVPPSHPDSNYRMAYETLLRHVPIDASNVFRIHTEWTDPAEAARDYEATIRDVCRLGPREWPRFDLVLLGIGADGHTASIFPGGPALQERTRIVVAPWVPIHRSFRITMTLPVFNHAARVVFLAAGQAKSAAVAAALRPPADEEPPPAALVQPVDGELTWLIDAAAAQLVQPTS